jgi:hypothetical protein
VGSCLRTPERKRGDRSCIRQPVETIRERPALDLDVLVRVERDLAGRVQVSCLPYVDVFRRVSRCRPEASQLAPFASAEAALFGELAGGRLGRCLPGLDLAGRKLEGLFGGYGAGLPNEHQLLSVQRDDYDRVGMLYELQPA